MTIDELAARLAALEELWAQIEVMRLRGAIETFELQQEMADGRLQDR